MAALIGRSNSFAKETDKLMARQPRVGFRDLFADSSFDKQIRFQV